MLYTEKLLKGEVEWSRSLKEDIRRVDCNLLSERCAGKVPLIAKVEERVGWPRLCDVTVNFGLLHTRGLQALSRMMSHHGRGSRPCPRCETASVLDHVLSHYKELGSESGTKLPDHLVDLHWPFLAGFRNMYEYVSI